MTKYFKEAFPDYDEEKDKQNILSSTIRLSEELYNEMSSYMDDDNGIQIPKDSCSMIIPTQFKDAVLSKVCVLCSYKIQQLARSGKFVVMSGDQFIDKKGFCAEKDKPDEFLCDTLEEAIDCYYNVIKKIALRDYTNNKAWKEMGRIILKYLKEIQK
jgi:hypothetical protein